MKYLIILILSFLVPSKVNAQVISIVSRESTIQEKVLDAFNDDLRMLDVVKCESDFKQFKNGKVLTSPTSDYGIMQINWIHLKEAERLGLDVKNSVDDNIKMGRIIYEKEGINAWVCNKLI